MYSLLRNILFLFNAEEVHYFSMFCLKVLYRIEFVREAIANKFTPPQNVTNFCGLRFRNPVGLGAGFDKNAKYLSELEMLGFGFIEIGTVTLLPQKGNSKPRLFRLPKDKALINRMGFNNDGAKVISARLKAWRENKQDLYQKEDTGLANHTSRMLIGGNLGKNKNTPNNEAWKDYEAVFLELFDHVDYFVINVSSPNTPGLRELQDKDHLQTILQNLQRINKSRSAPKPLLVKIAPDLDKKQLDGLISIAIELNLDGIVATNTTISRANLVTNPFSVRRKGTGGLSGQPLSLVSTEIIQYINEQTSGKIGIIGSGGIFNGEDALEKINAGAGLLQVWTGFVYEGPAIIKRICNYLTKTSLDNPKQI